MTGPVPPPAVAQFESISTVAPQPPSPAQIASSGAAFAPANAPQASVGAPGFLPPNDEVIAQLNNAQNFLAVAESMQLRRRFKGEISI